VNNIQKKLNKRLVFHFKFDRSVFRRKAKLMTLGSCFFKKQNEKYAVFSVFLMIF